MRGIILPAIAFLVTVVLISVLRPLASRFGLIDVPNSARKQHASATPMVGGIAMYLGILMAVLVQNMILPIDPSLYKHYVAFFWGTFLMVIVGALDDRRGLSTTARFAAQTVAILVMIYGADTRLSDLGAILPGGYVLQLGWFSVPFTIFACIGVINAINMCDGLDGLSGNLILVSLLGFGIANSIWGGPDRMVLLNIVSAAVAGFLLFNQRIFGRQKAWVFMGDAGSMMLGYTLAWAAVEVSQGAAAPKFVSPAMTLWLLALPLYDTVAIMLRRILAGKSPMYPDAEHLHHLLIRLGFPVGETIIFMCLMAGIGVGIGIVGTLLGVPEFFLALLFFVGGLVYLLLIDRAWKRRSMFGRSFVLEAD